MTKVSAEARASDESRLKRYAIPYKIYHQKFEELREVAKRWPRVITCVLRETNPCLGFTADTRQGQIDLIDFMNEVSVRLPYGMKILHDFHGFTVVHDKQYIPGDVPALPMPEIDPVGKWLH
jgi:hypothetical protein